jgi:hypothetical protein
MQKVYDKVNFTLSFIGKYVISHPPSPPLLDPPLTSRSQAD